MEEGTMSDKVKYLLIGLLLGAGLIFLMAQATSGTSAGSFQVAAGSNFYVVLDTRSGKVVEVKGDYSKQSITVSGIPAVISSGSSGGSNVDFPSRLSVNLSGIIGVSGVDVPDFLTVDVLGVN
jgi:hypothetical protein